MKKILVLLAGLLTLTGCGSSSKGVQGKTFVYDSCVKETVKAGTSEEFYDGNKAGADKESVVNSIVNKLYYHGTSDKTGELSFESNGVNGYTYNGSDIIAYEFNHVDFNETNTTCGGYYIPLDKNFTSIQFVDSASSFELTAYKFSLGINISYQDRNGETVAVIKQTSFVVTSAIYDASSKILTIDADVTYSNTVNDDVQASEMVYQLLFKEK